MLLICQAQWLYPFEINIKIRQMIGSRPLLPHLMLKQGQTWYPLSYICEMMEIGTIYFPASSYPVFVLL